MMSRAGLLSGAEALQAWRYFTIACQNVGSGTGDGFSLVLLVDAASNFAPAAMSDNNTPSPYKAYRFNGATWDQGDSNIWQAFDGNPFSAFDGASGNPNVKAVGLDVGAAGFRPVSLGIRAPTFTSVLLSVKASNVSLADALVSGVTLYASSAGLSPASTTTVTLTPP